jgi:predicted PurR-regulated permease PerM
MENLNDNTNAITRTTIEVSIRLLLVLILVAFCIAIMLPFLNPVLWGAIIAITLAPLYGKIKKWVGGKAGLATGIFILFFLVIIIVPSIWLIESLFDGLSEFGAQLKAGTLTIPPPEESVKDWPLVGKKFYAIWQSASDNLQTFISTYSEQFQKVGNVLLNSAIGLSSSILLFVVSFVIAGFFLLYGEAADKTFEKLFDKLMGANGDQVEKLAVVTIRNVAKGILLVAVIQSILSGIAFALAGVPFPGLWAFLVLFLGIIQLSPMLVGLPVIIYLYSTQDAVSATIWAIIILLISSSDNFLKPMLMGKGAPVPMLVIFIGAIGGFMFMGFIGLFTGAIILSLGYKLFQMWLYGPESLTSTIQKPESPDSINKK